MEVKMKGITCCGDCGYYNWEKHKCTRAIDEGNATDNFYADCPLPDVVVAQEPRVMTLEEVNALDWDYCYLEQERLPGKEYRGMLGKYIITCVTWPSITAAKISQGKDNYGRTWRCWTSRPTDEQRKAEEWNESD